MRARLLAAVLGLVVTLGSLSAPAASAQLLGDDGEPLSGVTDLLSPSPAPAPSSTPVPVPTTAPVPAPTGTPVPTTAPAPGAVPLLPVAPALPAPAPKLLGPPPASNSSARPGPGRSWTLTGSALTLGGSRYRGVVERDIGGSTVRTLHFTVNRLEITDLVQRGALSNGRIVRAAGSPGSVSTVINGPIELYTQELTGTLAVAGIPAVRTTLTAESVLMPDIDVGFLQLPDLTFRDVLVHNTDLAGGTLTIPGAHITLES